MDSLSESAEPVSLLGNPGILIIDDEDLMREVSSIMIEENGGVAFSAADGLEGVNVFKDNQPKIACVVVDYSMPSMNGHETFLEIRKLCQKVPIILVSGLKVTPDVEKLWRDGHLDFLAKPFREVELIRAINKHLA